MSVDEGKVVQGEARAHGDGYSGNFSVRGPRWLHRALAEVAEMNNATLNANNIALLAWAQAQERDDAIRRFTRVFLTAKNGREYIANLARLKAEGWYANPRRGNDPALAQALRQGAITVEQVIDFNDKEAVARALDFISRFAHELLLQEEYELGFHTGKPTRRPRTPRSSVA